MDPPLLGLGSLLGDRVTVRDVFGDIGFDVWGGFAVAVLTGRTPLSTS